MRRVHCVKHVLVVPVIIAGFSAIVMLLWNCLMPDIFGCQAINFWQALGLLALARILFGGFGKHRMRTDMMHHHHNPLREKWQKMTPEERMEFVKKHRFHHGFEHRFGHDFFQHDETERQRQDEESETK